MRLTRASVLTAVVAASAICAGPLVGVALAAPALLSSSPADHALFTDAATLPTVVSATYDKALYSPTSPVFPSSIRVTLNGGIFNCTASLSADMKTLICTPFTGVKFADGVYNVDVTASPAPTTGDASATHSSFTFTVDTTPPQLNTRSPLPNSRTNATQPSVVATYKENLADTPPDASTLTVTNSLSNVLGGSSVVTNPAPKSGVVTWTPAGPLPDGDYTATSHVTDLHGLTSTNSWTFTVDTKAPEVPTVTAPTWVNIANEGNVPITGTAVNDTGGASQVQVTVTRDGTHKVVLAPVNVGNDGTWAATPVADVSSLSDGPLTVTAVAIDEAGNTSADSAAANSTKDTAAPTPTPTVSFPDAPLDVNHNPVVNAANSSLHVHGTTEPFAGVSVTATDGSHTTTPATTTADSNGVYDAVVETATLNQGTLTIASTATDAAGNTATGTNTITKDSVPPGTPIITTFDNVNAASDPNLHTVSGTASTDPGTTLNVWLTDTASGITSVLHPPINGSTGAWSTQLPVGGLAEGQITAHAQSFDVDNNPSTEATKVATKDTSPPAQPTLTPPTWVNIANKAAVPVSGTAEPFTTVHLVATDSGAGSKTADIPVAADGTWATTLDLHALADGALAYAATVHDGVDNLSAEQDDTSTKKDTVAPSTPAAPTLGPPDVNTGVVAVTGSGVNGDTIVATLTSDGGAGQATSSPATVGSGAYSAPVDASSLADGTLTGTVVETDPAGNSSATSPSATVIKDTTAPFTALSTTPVDGSSLQTTPSFSATYNEQIDLAGSSVTLKDPLGAVLGHTPPTLSADKKTISFAPTNSPLSEGSGYQAIFNVKDLSDAETLATTVHFTVDRTSPAAPVVSSVAGIFTGNVTGVPVSGTASEPGDAIAVTLTDGTQDAGAVATVQNDGTWASVVDASGLGDGAVSATATQTDAAGNISAVSAATPSSKDTVAPAQPTVLWSGPITATQSLATLSGSGEPNSTVDVSVDDGDSGTSPVAGQTTAAGDGSWSKQLDLSSLTDGTLTATAWQTDGAGNVGAANTADGTKDATAPSAPTVGFSGPVTIAVPSVTLSGAGEDGDTVSISVDDADGATAPVTDSAVVSGGAWSKQLDLSSLSDGTLTATVTQTDEVGNQSTSGQGTGLKDATAPGSPTIDVAGPATSSNVTAVPLSGTGATGDTINLQVSDGTHPPVTASLPVTAGAWSTTLDLHALADGPLAVSADEVDPVNNAGSPALRTFAKDTTAPDKPTLSWSNAVTKLVHTVTFTGTAEPGSTVDLSVDDANAATPAVTDSLTAGQDGSWLTQLDLSGLDDGSLLATAAATDGFSNQGAAQTAPGIKDTVVPTARMLGPTRPFVLSTAQLSWTGSDVGSGLAVHAFDVRWARARHGAALGSYVGLLTGVSGTSASRALGAGTTGCFEVRSHDVAGNVSAWGAARCTTAALDDKALTASAGWIRISNSRLFHGSARQTTQNGATLTLGRSRLHRVAVAATTCGSCGSIVVFVGSHRVGVINLHSAHLHRRVLITLPLFGMRTAAVRIKVTSSGKQVQIDGVGTTAR